MGRGSASAMRALDALPPLRVALLLYLISFAVLLIVGWTVRFRTGFAMLEADESEYMSLSAEIVRGVWTISPRRTLAYPALLAGIRSVWDDLLVIQIVVTSLFALSAPALFAVVRRVTGSNAMAVGSALAFAVWPPAIFYGTSLYSETLALPIFLAALALLPAGSRVGVPTRTAGVAALSAGLVLGIAAQVRPMYLLFVPLLPLVVLVEEKHVATAVRRILLAIAGFAIVVLPWSFYMSQRYDRVIVLTANGGETLAGGLTPRLLEPTGRYTIHSGNRSAWVGPGKWLPIYENGYLSIEEQARPYAQTDPLLQQRTLSWIFAHPTDAAFLELRKLSYMWGIYPLAENGMTQFLFGNLPTLMMLALTLLFLATSRDARVKLVRLWILALFVSGVALISWGSWRFRQPADAGLLSFVVCGLFWRLRRSSVEKNGTQSALPTSPDPRYTDELARSATS